MGKNWENTLGKLPLGKDPFAKYLKSKICTVVSEVSFLVGRVVNRFLFRFSIVFKNDHFVFGKTIVFLKTICDRF